MRAPSLIMHCYFSKNEFERALVALALGMKNPRGRLGLVVRLSTLADRGGKIIQIFHCTSLWLSFSSFGWRLI
jgi:hypothetical protein